VRNFILFICILFFGALLGCLVGVDMPRISKAAGYTTGTQNIAKVNCQFAGVLNNLQVSDKSPVKRGDILGEVTTERFVNGHNLDAEQATLTEQKRSLTQDELNNINRLEQANQKQLVLRMNTDKLQMDRVSQELLMSRQRLTDLITQLDRQEALLKQGFVSTEAVEQKRSELLVQKIAISTLERTLDQLKSDFLNQQQELLLSTSRAQTQRSQALAAIVSLQQELNENLAKKTQLVAPIDGVITQISASVGQTVRPDSAIMTIVPIQSHAEVLLLVPSQSIGFIRVGQRVSVRYQAYPYEHYGRHWGMVKEIASAALPPQDVAQHIRVDQPVYTVRVSLPANYLDFHGTQLPITPGMLVDADVELDRLKIYQWLLEPLFRLGARV
jgi:membrane fusion protein